jgi:transcriptional regulator with XRE-family HTH domain
MARKRGPQPAPITVSRIALAKGIETALRYNKEKNRKPRTMEEMAQMAGVSIRTVQNMKNMSNSPEIGNIDKVASTLGMSAWALLYVEEDADLLYVMESYKQATEEGRSYMRLTARTVRADSGMSSEPKRRSTDAG